MVYCVPKRSGSFSAVLVFVLLLSGCAGQQTNVPLANPTGPDGPTESATAPAPKPTLTPTPAALDLADPSSWIIGFTGIGPLAIGAELSASSQSMTAFTSGNIFEGCPSIVSFDRPGFPNIVITDRYDDGLVELIALEGGPTPSEFTATSPRTSSGIGIGATLEELMGAYPAITYQDDHFTPHYALPDGDGNWINFAMYEGLVNKIVVRPMSVIPRELCG
jgi:hypothetical protein